MGRKKKRVEAETPWCFYCDLEFRDLAQLLQHQKAKHFRCPTCRKKFQNAPGMAVHIRQVHKHELREVPNALRGREDPWLEIIGMQGLPENNEHVKKRRRSAMDDGGATPGATQAGSGSHSGAGFGFPPSGPVPGLGRGPLGPPGGPPPGAPPPGVPPPGAPPPRISPPSYAPPHVVPPGMPPPGLPPPGLPPPGMLPPGMVLQGMPPPGMPPPGMPPPGVPPPGLPPVQLGHVARGPPRMAPPGPPPYGMPPPGMPPPGAPVQGPGSGRPSALPPPEIAPNVVHPAGYPPSLPVPGAVAAPAVAILSGQALEVTQSGTSQSHAGSSESSDRSGTISKVGSNANQASSTDSIKASQTLSSSGYGTSSASGSVAKRGSDGNGPLANGSGQEEAGLQPMDESFQHDDPNLVFPFEMLSMEEKRAELDRYKFDPRKLQSQLSQLDSALAVHFGDA